MADCLTRSGMSAYPGGAGLSRGALRTLRRQLLTYAGVLVMLVAFRLQAMGIVCIGDCNSSGTVTVDEILTMVNIALGNTPLSQCTAGDANCDSQITVDEILAAVNNALNGCSTVAPQAASANIRVLNPTGAAATVTVDGRRTEPSGFNGRGLLANYTVAGVVIPGNCSGACTCPPGVSCTLVCDLGTSLPRCDIPVANLATGIWTHKISVSATGQQQFRQSLLVSDPAKANNIEPDATRTYDWTVFKTVLTVNRADDPASIPPAGTCPTSPQCPDVTNGCHLCTLRQAVTTANGAAAPVLIGFDHGSFLNGIAAVTLTQVLSPAAVTISHETTLDGTDVLGNPSPLAAFTSRIYPTSITLDPTDKTRASADDLFLNAKVTLLGLTMKRILIDVANDSQIIGKDQNLVVPGTNSAGSRIATCRLDGGAAARTDANGGDGGMSVAAQGKDCVDAGNTGSTSANPVTIENSEIRFCYDRGVKSQSGYVLTKDSWVHNNLRGGFFAQTGGIAGTIKAATNLIEQNGVNCPAGAGPGFSGYLSDCGAQAVTRTDASELSAQPTTSAKLSRLETDGNVIRDGAAQGIYFQTYSTGSIANDYICGMHRAEVTNPKGILIKRTGGAMSDISVAGASVVYNVEGAKMDETIGAKFGDGSTGSGNNAFTQNGASSTAKKNLINAQSAAGVQARGNQWQNCYTGQADKNFCKTSAILTNDVKNTVDVGRISPDSCDPANGCQPYQALGSVVPLTINPNGVYPTKVSEAGTIVHITGTGFDAISGHTGQSSGNCKSLKQTNSCNPLQGTCVQFDVDGVLTEVSDVLAVTPTHLVVTSPFACTKPARVLIKRNGRDGPVTFETSQTMFCQN